jgi:soluble lytic murein transglycosylase
MLKKRQKKQISLIAGAGLCAFLAGGMVAAPQIGKSLGQWLKPGKTQPEQLSEATVAKSVALPLVIQSPQERAAKLGELAKGSQSPDKNRARYLLASDLIEQKDGKGALKLLDGLENDYPLLAPYVLLKRAQAHEVAKEDGKASDLRQEVVKRYSKEAASAKALYLIGLPEFQDKAIAGFPSNPLTWEIIKKRLEGNPNQPQLQLTLAKFAYDQPGIIPVLDQLTASPNLKPEEWEVIATAYWENSEFGKASTAYAKANRTARNLYRTARGLQVGGQNEQAIAIYQQQLQEFPEARETATALMRMAEIQKVRRDAIPYLDQVVAKFPDKAGTALLEKVKILESQRDAKGAEAARQLLITKYGSTEEAAEYRWFLGR